MSIQKEKKRSYKVRTAYNDSGNTPGRIFTLPSLTVPSQTLGLRQLLDMHTRGIPMPVAMTMPVYEDPENPADGIHYKNLDLVDIQNLRENAKDEIKNYRSRVEEQARLAKAAALQKEIEGKLEAERQKALKEGAKE